MEKINKARGKNAFTKGIEREYEKEFGKKKK